MTTVEKCERIYAIWDLAAREHRPVTDAELEEIERLSAEIYDSANPSARPK